MPDDEFSVAVHLRLALPLQMPPACAACTRAGMPAAQAQQDPHGVHALCCPRGPGHTGRHERVKHAWARVLEDALGAPPLVEQVIPEWGAADGREARLDLSFALPGGPRICSAQSGGGGWLEDSSGPECPPPPMRLCPTGPRGLGVIPY